MRNERTHNRLTLAAALALACLLAPFPAVADEEKKKEEPKQEEPKQEEPKQEKAAAPKPKARVFTNADLKRLAESGSGSVTGGSYTHDRSTPSSAPRPQLEAPPAPPAPVQPQAFPEDRPESATVPELQDRLPVLQAEQEYLAAKQRWMRNPLLPQPIPPPGEDLVDKTRTGADQMRDTERRLRMVENRLNRVRALLKAAGLSP